MKPTSLKKTFFKVVSRIALWAFQLFPVGCAKQRRELITLISRLDSLVQTRGLEWTLNYIKGTRQCFLAYLSGKPVSVPGVKQTSDGLPCVLGDLVPLIRGFCSQGDGNHRLLAYINTILFSTRALKLGAVPDFETITLAPKKGIPGDLSSYTVQFWKELGYKPSRNRFPRTLEFKKFHETFKAGPNGPALASS